MHNEKMSNPIRLGTNLKVLLKTRRLSLKRVSHEAGIPYSTLHTWLENRQPKDILKVKQLCDYLEVGLHELLFGVADPVLGGAPTILPGVESSLEGVYEVTIRRRGRS